MKMKNIKKLIASATLSAALVFGAVSTASAFWAGDGNIVIGIVGPNEEYALEIPGTVNFEDPVGKYEIPVGGYSDLWDFTDIDSTFTGVTSLSDLRINTFGTVAESGTGRFYAYFAVQKGEIPDVNRTAMESFIAQCSDINTYHNTAYEDTPSASFKASNRSQTIDWSLGPIGRYGMLLRNEIGQELLTDLAVDNPIELEIWMAGDDHWMLGENYDGNWDFPASKTNYLVRIGVDDAGMVYAETAAVPIPGAVWLLGSGILAIMGMRRRNNG